MATIGDAIVLTVIEPNPRKNLDTHDEMKKAVSSSIWFIRPLIMEEIAAIITPPNSSRFLPHLAAVLATINPRNKEGAENDAKYIPDK